MRTLSLAQQDFEEGGGTLETDGSAHRNLDIGVKRFRYFLRSVRDNMIITKKNTIKLQQNHKYVAAPTSGSVFSRCWTKNYSKPLLKFDIMVIQIKQLLISIIFSAKQSNSNKTIF